MSRPADRFETYDAAYVLGALSPEDRAAFEAHLKECPDCARSVQELAGLPGLLAQVEPEMVDPAEPPGGTLPSIVGTVRRIRRRRTVATFAVGAVAAAAVAVAVVLPQGLGGDGVPGSPMTSLIGAPVQATVAVAKVDGGSRVDMSCEYKGAKQGADYVLVAIRPDGTERNLATWWANPNRTATMSLDTSMAPDQIRSLELRSASGLTLLRWQP
ncbi:anti-sigma factor family protein [Amycolatopsis alkalitolerans]|uniref:Anti-sigma factor n=1 Tax=Amycolatopsis alkalitolerans TaxID=2547244 RepID=A0A5C4M607_9PSEU|nr:zf-HC2 domain-containing protein [Amycolatopsis alkalitolerans]TNC27031.1 anti-sigma factor [Amycolatopsis alkalitolerans]